MSLLVLSSKDVETIASTFSADHLAGLMAQAFSQYSHSLADSPPRNVITTGEYTALFMPSNLPTHGTAIKVVSIPSSGSSKDGPPATSLVLDAKTGAVNAVVNARTLTALRNAAGSLLSIKLIGPAEPINVTLFGAGAQILAHLAILSKAYPSIQKYTVINRTINGNPRIQTIKTKKPNVHVEFVTLADTRAVGSALRDADVVITATPSTVSLFPSNFVKPGAHVIMIGSYKATMREVDDDLLTIRGESTLLVDSRESCQEEAGELISSGIPSSSWIEIGEMVKPAKNKDGFEFTEKGVEVRARFRELAERGGVTIFKSVGLGVQDVAITSAVVEAAAAERGSLGTVFKEYDV